jgi:hypothetical protein
MPKLERSWKLRREVWIAILTILVFVGLPIALLWLWFSGPAQSVNNLLGNSPSAKTQQYLKAHGMPEFHQTSIIWWSHCCSTRDTPVNEANAATVVVSNNHGQQRWVEVYDERDEADIWDYRWQPNWTVKQVYDTPSEVFVPEVCEPSCVKKFQFPPGTREQ